MRTARWNQPDTDTPACDLTAERLRDYVGNYRSQDGKLTLTFSEKDGQLFVFVPGQPEPLPLQNQTESRFYFTDRGIEIVFFTDDNGQVTHMETRRENGNVRRFDRAE